MITHGAVADFALVAEGTGFGIVGIEPGKAHFKVTVFTDTPRYYTPYLPRPTGLADAPNAIVRTAAVIAAFERWAYDYQVSEHLREPERHDRAQGDRSTPSASGYPFGLTSAPQLCSFYVDTRILPGANPLDLRDELRGVLRDVGVEGTVELFLYRPGFEATGAERLIETVRRCHDQVFDTPPAIVGEPVTSMWRDTNAFNELGIPAISYAPAVDEPCRPQGVQGQGPDRRRHRVRSHRHGPVQPGSTGGLAARRAPQPRRSRRAWPIAAAPDRVRAMPAAGRDTTPRSGVPATATQREIRAAYRRLARETHPDRHAGPDRDRERQPAMPRTAGDASDQRSARGSSAIARAYEVIGDPKRRRAYDERLARGRFAAPGTGGPATYQVDTGPVYHSDLGHHSDFYQAGDPISVRRGGHPGRPRRRLDPAGHPGWSPARVARPERLSAAPARRGAARPDHPATGATTPDPSAGATEAEADTSEA